MGLRTIHLKLHNPSTLKRKIIDTAFINYNNAYNYLLKNAFENIDEIKDGYKSPKGTYGAFALSKWVDKEMSAQINQFDVQPFKDSLKLDFGMTLASFLVQKESNPIMPFPSFKSEEVKSQNKGILMMGHDQKQRLRYSLKFITALLGCRGKLVLLSQPDNRVD